MVDGLARNKKIPKAGPFSSEPDEMIPKPEHLGTGKDPQFLEWKSATTGPDLGPVTTHRLLFGNPFKSGFFLGLGFFTAALVISIVAFAIAIIIGVAAGGSLFHAANTVSNG